MLRRKMAAVNKTATSTHRILLVAPRPRLPVTEYARLVQDTPRLGRLHRDDAPTWESLQQRWLGSA